MTKIEYMKFLKNKNAISKSNGNVFLEGKYIGEVDTIFNWGTNFLARNKADSTKNKFFKTKSEAVIYLININSKGE